MDSDRVTVGLAFTVYLAVVCYTGVWVYKWVPLWVLAAVVMALTPCGPHVEHECGFLIRMCDRASAVS